MAKELILNAKKLKRLTEFLKGGGASTREEAENVLRIRKPEYITAYLAKAMENAGIEGEPADGATPPSEEGTTQGADTSGDTPLGEGEKGTTPAPTPTPTPAPTLTPTPTPTPTPAPTPTPTPTSSKLARFVNKDGQTIKLVVKSETAKAIIYEEDVPKEMVTIMVKGSPVQVNALDDSLTPDIRQAVELARA